MKKVPIHHPARQARTLLMHDRGGENLASDGDERESPIMSGTDPPIHSFIYCC